MVTETTLIEFAVMQYNSDGEFKAFADEWLGRLRAQNSALPMEAQACFAEPVNEVGTPLAKYVLEGFEASKGKAPYASG